MTATTALDTADLIDICDTYGPVEIILADSTAVRSWMVGFIRFGRYSYGNLVDGAVPTDAELAAPKQYMNEITFTAAARRDLGIFVYTDSCHAFFHDFAARTAPIVATMEGPIRALLSVEDVSFVAKHGPRRGERIEFVKPVLKLLGTG
jgi:hypothetical protein